MWMSWYITSVMDVCIHKSGMAHMFIHITTCHSRVNQSNQIDFSCCYGNIVTQ